MSDVFLSHNSADKPAIEALALRLRAEGIEPWLDKWNLIPGNAWQEEIEQALEQCRSCAVFIGLSGIGPWQNAEMRAAIDRRIGKGNFRVVPVLLPGASRGKESHLPTFLSATTWVQFRDTLDDAEVFRRLVCGIRGIKPGPGITEIPANSQRPYRGLQVFDTKHAPLFFGRSARTDWLLDAIRPSISVAQSSRFLAIVGDSGSGKSSLARAGLLAALTGGKLPDSQNWPQIVLKPGGKPLESLAIALCSHEQLGKRQDTADLIKKFKQHGPQLHWLCRKTLHGQPQSRRVVILVDQFEEVFSLCGVEDERKAFIDNLLTAATDATGQAIVLLTMRADFYGKCAPYPQLGAALSDDQFLLGPMNKSELREAILAPAQRFGCEVEPALVERLLSDVARQPGSLPLLEHALERLWDQRQSRKLRLEDYKGLEEALEEWANQNYNSLTPAQQALCQRIFLRLVQPGEGTEDTRRRARLDELGDSKDAEHVIKILADARLITTQQQFAEVAHETLIHNWSVLRGWVEQDREALRMQHRISETAQEWDQNRRGEDWLLTGSRLQVAEEWLASHHSSASELEKDFILAGVERRDWVSAAAQQWERNRRGKDWLLTGSRLQAAREWLQIRGDSASVLEKKFIRHSRATPWVKGLKFGFSVASLLLMGSYFWWWAKTGTLTPRAGFYLILAKLDLYYLQPEMLKVPPDRDCSPKQPCTFQMGLSSEWCEKDSLIRPDECPQHAVTFTKPFRMGKYEVTFDEYESFLRLIDRDGGCDDKHKVAARLDQYRGWGQGRRPVINVSWEDANCYAEWLSKKTNQKEGHDYRLPTEAEWEYAARAASPAVYFWGDPPDQAEKYAWYSENSVSTTHPVGEKQPNAFGLYDTAGNVWEWVRDCSTSADYEGALTDGSAWEMLNETKECEGGRWLRGGSWASESSGIFSASRVWPNPGIPPNSRGFRLAQNL